MSQLLDMKLQRFRQQADSIMTNQLSIEENQLSIVEKCVRDNARRIIHNAIKSERDKVIDKTSQKLENLSDSTETQLIETLVLDV